MFLIIAFIRKKFACINNVILHTLPVKSLSSPRKKKGNLKSSISQEPKIVEDFTLAHFEALLEYFKSHLYRFSVGSTQFILRMLKRLKISKNFDPALTSCTLAGS